MSTSSEGSRSPMGVSGGLMALLLILGGIIVAFGACALLPQGPTGNGTATVQTQAAATARAKSNATATAQAQHNATATAAIATVQAQVNLDATATITAILGGNCPNPSAVAQVIGDNVANNVHPLTDEICAFKLDNVSRTRTVHCPTRYGKVSFQYTLPGIETQHIRGCNGTETTSFPIDGATVRFVNWEPAGDVCIVWGQSPSGSILEPPGTKC